MATATAGANLTDTAASDLTNTAAVLTNTAASDLTNTALAANLTASAEANNTGTAAANQTGTAVNVTNTAAANQTGTSAANLTATAIVPLMGVVISEFRTRGPDGGNDEFIELYNRSGLSISIGNWSIEKSSGCGTSTDTIVDIPSGVIMQAGQHYLIGGEKYSGSVLPDLPDETMGIANNGGIALITDASAGAIIVDQVGLCATTAYFEGTALSELTSDTDRSYDRNSGGTGICVDTNNNAADFILRSPSDPQNSSSPLKVCGNPTPVPTVTSTPTASRTPTRTRTPTPVRTATRTPVYVPPPPPPLIVINEFVPRPGHDWNNDGITNTDDEYIELLNHGVIDVNLSGYKLDDEANIGSNPFALPSTITLKPGERIVFYGSDTGLLLSDGGDGVRLLKPNGQLMDAYNYFIVEFPDQAFCRLPDNGGADDWSENCFPTPGLKNSLSGTVLRPPTQEDEDQPLCPIADTLPEEFVLAECTPFGNNIWNRYYWDKYGWYGEKSLPNVDGRWEVFAD